MFPLAPPFTAVATIRVPARGLRGGLRNPAALTHGLTPTILQKGVKHVYRVLDDIDATLLEDGVRLSEIIELANLSSVLGNLLALGIVRASGGVFTRAGPHKYQDLRANRKDAANIEIKIALEDNKPKGHLPKPGHYLIGRYVLGDADGTRTIGERGSVVWFWEIRFGELALDDFSISNTAGDSGKTAVVKTASLKKLRLVYFDEPLCPYKRVNAFLKAFGE